MNTNTFSSPQYKLVVFFKKSRDKWKNRAQERRDRIRDMEARVRDLETSRNLWKAKAAKASKQIQAKDSEIGELQETAAEASLTLTKLQRENEGLKKNFLRRA